MKNKESKIYFWGTCSLFIHIRYMILYTLENNLLIISLSFILSITIVIILNLLINSKEAIQNLFRKEEKKLKNKKKIKKQKLILLINCWKYIKI